MGAARPAGTRRRLMASMPDRNSRVPREHRTALQQEV